VDEIVSFLRAYAQRCLTVHPVKQYFDEGDVLGLQRAIIRDYREVNFFGEDHESEDLKDEIRGVLRLVIRVFFDNWSWEEGRSIRGSKALDDLRKAFEAQMRKKIPFFGKKGFEDDVKPDGSDVITGENMEKGVRTREKSPTEGKFLFHFSFSSFHSL